MVRWVTGFVDSPDRSVEGFWAAVTASSVRRGDGTLVPADGDGYLRVRNAGNHLVLHVERVAEFVGRVRSLGAVVVRDDGSPVVCRSPAGLVFGVVAWAGERVRPSAVDGSLADQMCLDVPVGVFEAEAGFWAALTGWERRRTDLPEFDYLVRPPAVPLRLLLQRTGGAVAGMHLDFAAVDVAATVARQVALGAEVVRRVPGQWTTLRDPAGREYCVTARVP